MRDTPERFVAEAGNYDPAERGISGKVGRALAGWKDCERRLAEIAQIIESEQCEFGSLGISSAAAKRIEALAKGAKA